MTIRSTIQHNKNLFYSWRFFFSQEYCNVLKKQVKIRKRETPFFFSEFFGLGKNNNKDFSRDPKILSWYRSPVWGAKLWGAKISSNLPNLDSLCLNWPFGVEIGLYLMQIASKIGQLNTLTNCLVFLVSLGQISLVNFYLVSKPRNFCSLFLVSHPTHDKVLNLLHKSKGKAKSKVS